MRPIPPLLLAAVLAAAPHAEAALCQQSKLAATGKRTSATLKCSATAVKNGTGVSPDCVTKAANGFTTVFTKADAAGNCPTPGDAPAVGAQVTACVADILASMGAGSPPAPPAACLQAKIKASAKRAQSDFKCWAKAAVIGAVADPECLGKSHTKFDADFVKAEAKTGCALIGDTPLVASTIDTCVSAVLGLLPVTTTTTSTTTTTTTSTTTTTVAGSAQLDFTALGYFTPTSIFHLGMPSASYVPQPSGLTYAELEQLQRDCIDRINAYRTGILKFSDGSSDPGVPKPAIAHLMGNDRCSSAQALGDLYANNGGSACAGAHTNAFSCPYVGSVGQNTCCRRSGATYTAVRNQLYSCLQAMWDEGIGLPDNAGFSGANGHWWNMRNAGYGYAHCGFAFTAGGSVWMNQDFTGDKPASVPLTCSCAGQNVGDADGCGGTCVAP